MEGYKILWTQHFKICEEKNLKYIAKAAFRERLVDLFFRVEVIICYVVLKHNPKVKLFLKQFI